MYHVARRPGPVSEQLSIYWWRLVVYAMRWLNRFKVRAVPVCSPLRPYLWVPVLALMCGILIGWVIAVA